MTRRLDERDDGATITLAPGDELVLRLAENRTTGFRWHIERDPAPCCPVIADEVEPAPPRPGAAAVHVWRLGAAREGSAQLWLALRRPWEAVPPPARRYRLAITVARR